MDSDKIRARMELLTSIITYLVNVTKQNINVDKHCKWITYVTYFGFLYIKN